jgi:hypothetical protein
MGQKGTGSRIPDPDPQHWEWGTKDPISLHYLAQGEGKGGGCVGGLRPGLGPARAAKWWPRPCWCGRWASGTPPPLRRYEHCSGTPTTTTEKQSSWTELNDAAPETVAQGVTKRFRLSWLTNSALVYEPKYRGRGWVAGYHISSTAVHRSPNKLWRSISIFNLCCSLMVRINCKAVDANASAEDSRNEKKYTYLPVYKKKHKGSLFWYKVQNQTWLHFNSPPVLQQNKDKKKLC